MKVYIALLLAMGLAGASAWAGEERATALPAFQVSVDLVQMDAVVTDKNGRLVTDLAPGDFTILEDGKPQRIATVTFVNVGADAFPGGPRAHGAPRNIVLVYDDLGLSFFAAAAAQRALERFASQPFEPGDHVGLVRTSQVESSYTFYGSNRELARAVSRLAYNLKGAGRDAPPLAPTAMRDIYADRMGTILGTIDGMRSLPGRKALVLLSEGLEISEGSFLDSRLRTSYDSLLSDSDLRRSERLVTEIANRASVVLYAIDPGGLGLAGDWRAQATLVDFATRTGGLAIVNRNDIAAALRTVVADQGGYYLIGYEPRGETFAARRSGAPRFHKVKVRVGRGGLKVRARAGFYGVTDDDLPPGSGPRIRFELLRPL